MKQIILLLLIILLSTTFVYSRGNSELSQIDIAKQLLEEKKYNEAIAVLTTYMSKNPSTIYEVQTLLDEIKDKREVNNTIMNDLITAIFDDENYDKGFELIKELEKNDPYPDELSKLFLRDAREGATFVINKKAFNNYMDQALEHLNNDEFTEALDLYLLCLDFHADEFDLLMTSNQNSILEVDLNSFDEDKPVDGYYLSLKNSSKKEIDLIKDETIGLKELIVQLKDNYTKSLDIIIGDVIDVPQLITLLSKFKDVPNELDRYLNRKSKLDSYNDLFRKISLTDSKSKYITYATLTLKGREGISEGFLYVINSIFPLYINDLISKIELRIESNLDKSIEMYSSERYLDATTSFKRTFTDFESLNAIASTWKSFVKIDNNYNITGRDVLVKNYSYIGDSEIGQDLITSYLELSNSLSLIDKEALKEDLEEFRSFIVSQRDIINSDAEVWIDKSKNVNDRKIMLYNKSPDRVAALNLEYKRVLDLLVTREINTVDSISRIDYIDIFEKDVTDKSITSDAMGELIADASTPTDILEEISVFFGINETDQRSLNTYNPEKTIANLDAIEGDYEKYIVNLNSYIAKFENEKDYIFNNINFKSRFDSVSKALTLANSNRTVLDGNRENALKKIILSRESENRGYDLYDQAFRAFENEEFTVAREDIDRAKDVAEQSISFSKNRRVIDDLIPSLYNLEDQITQEEARIVIRDVRRLITLGKNKYLEGAYIPASNIFKEAELKWAKTNTDPHPEIPYWLALIRDALDIESGRYLSITEPLYSVLAGYLSFAENYYRIGLTEKNKVDKLRAFDRADNYLVKILEVRPLNERARLLQLQVLKSKDPEAFKITFINDFTRYRNDVIRSIENKTSISSNQILPLLSSYETIIEDAYLLKPKLSGTIRRDKLERFYKPVSTLGKSSKTVANEKADNSEKRQIISKAYSRFKDLYKIADRDQKDIVRRMINLSEVALGFRRLPVDISNIRESDSIFIKAKNRLDSSDNRDVDILNSILQELKLALSLNPGNEDIPILIDDILVMLGEESNFQLAPNEDKLFRDAQKDFIDGNYYDSKDKIIIILKANVKNKNYPKLKELINRVEVKIKEEINI